MTTTAHREELSPLRIPAFRALAAGRLIDMLGNSVATVALAFAVLDLTGSLTYLGLVVGARTVANVIFVLFGGVLADRMPRRLLLVSSTGLAAVSQAAVAAVVLTGIASVPLLVVLSAVNGLAAAVALPASAALLPQTVPEGARQRANSVIRLGMNAANILGVSVGGILVAAIGPGEGLAIDALSFAIAGLCFALVRVGPHTTSERSESLTRQLRDGWTEVRSRDWVWIVVLTFLVLNACFGAYMEVLGPYIADTSFGRRDWGFIVGAQGVGLLFGALLAMRIRVPRLLLLGCACMASIALMPLMLAVWPSTVPLMVAAFAAGLGLDVFAVAWDTSLQQHIPEDKLARVVSYDILGSVIAIPVAQIAAPPVVHAIGLGPTLWVMTLVVLGCVLAMVTTSGVRSLRQPGH
ncbi:MFS transporter [Sciscionella marina]|uniref:MFS transporter n=1 Tax=Sciscionella marina TaxID=508770 RepID=UPI000363D1EE|nr:MFS transporter [Sciscionella marina]